MDYLDLKYANLLAPRLDRFKVTSTNPYRINFRCPVCGDSKKDETKARGWLLESDKNGRFTFYCHNCYWKSPFYQFLKEQDRPLFDRYLLEKFTSKPKRRVDRKPVVTSAGAEEKLKLREKDPTTKLKKISELGEENSAKKYVMSRKLPDKTLNIVRYCPRFKSWVNTFIPGKFDVKYDEPRIVFTLYDENKQFFGVAARSLNSKGLRYLTIKTDQSKPKFYGLDRVDFNKPYTVVEGPIDSLFLDNCIAMVGADGNLDGLKNTDNATFVFDNEPRNAEVVSRMKSAIKKKLRIVIWPSSIAEKDINDMVLAGHNVENIIKRNSFRGIDAELKLAFWSKK